MTAPPRLLAIVSLVTGQAVPAGSAEPLLRELPPGSTTTTWASTGATLASASVHGDLVVAFAGRLDGRHRDGRPEDHVAAAYREVGDAAGDGLLGEFTFVVYDTSRHRLLAYRDPSGSRPLFWWTDGRTFVASSDLPTVLRWPTVPRRLNEGVIGELVAGSPTTMSETLWDGVFRLPGGHRLSAGVAGVFVARSWSPADPSQTPPTTFEEMQHRTRQVVLDAVEDRLLGHDHIGVDVSGGLDSSTLVGVAHHLRENGRLSWTDITTFTAAVAGEAGDADFVRSVAERWGLRTSITRPTPLPLDAVLETAARHRGLPDLVPGWGRMYRDAPGSVGVVLAGHGGDEFLRGTGTLLPGLLVDRRLADLRNALAPAGSGSRRGLWPNVVHPLLVDYLPRPLRRSSWRRDLPVEWLRPEFAARSCLRERLDPPRPPLGTPSQRAYARLFSDPWPTIVAESIDRVGVESSVTISSPLWDRRLVSLAWATPDRLRHRPGQPGELHRSAFGDLLPAAVRDRRSKADGALLVAEQWRAMGARDLLASPRLEALGAIDAAVAIERYDAFTHALGEGRWLTGLHWPLALTLAAETWMRANCG